MSVDRWELPACTVCGAEGIELDVHVWAHGDPSLDRDHAFGLIVGAAHVDVSLLLEIGGDVDREALTSALYAAIDATPNVRVLDGLYLIDRPS